MSWFSTAFICFSVFSALSQPSPSDVASRIPDSETGRESDHLTGEWGGGRTRLVERGVHFHLGYSGEWFGNLSGGQRRGSILAGLVEASVDLDAGQLLGWKGATFRASGLYPHGNSLSESFVGDLFTLSNIDAYDSLKLFELWWQQALWGERFSLRLGQLAADEEFAHTEFGGLFLNSAFGWIPCISGNVPAPSFPTAAPGARLRVEPAPALWLQSAVYDGNPDPGKARGGPANRYGTSVNLGEGALLLFEIGYRLNEGARADARVGTYKIGGWYHTDDFVDYAAAPAVRTRPGNWGLYLAAEQFVWAEDSGSEENPEQGLGFFCRLGGTPRDRNRFSLYAEAGAHYTGLLPGRESDMCGLAMAYGHISPDLRAAMAPPAPRLDYELVMELTYMVSLKSWWTVQPDIQYIIQPGATRSNRNALVAGLRSSIVF